MFTKEKILKIYDRLYADVFKKLDDESEAITGERYSEIHKWRFIHDILLLPPLQPGARILEIGPSMTSVLLQQLTAAKVEALCIDECNRNFLDKYDIPLYRCDISTDIPPLQPKSYDCILFCQVLEHCLYSPDHALTTIFSLLKPGKCILFSVPNFASIQNRMHLLLGKNPQEPLHSQYTHYSHIREPVYAEALQWWHKAGGVIVKEGFTNYDESQPGGMFSKIFWTARFCKIQNWYGLAHIWFPKTRQYFYLLITTGDGSRIAH